MVRRSSARRRAAARGIALLAMIGSVGAGWACVTSSDFAVTELSVEGDGANLTGRAAIEAAIGPLGEGVFHVRTVRIEQALAVLPAVESASVTVALPGTLRVVLRERRPVVAWVVGQRRLAVDADGLVLAEFTRSDPGPSAGLASIVDRRTGAEALAVGGHVNPLDLDIATRLASLTPEDVGSAKLRLVVAVDDTDGFTLQPAPGGPIAVFGFYTPTLRPPDLVPGQVRLLRSLMIGREAKLGRIMLASEDGGTYLPKGVAPGPLAPAASIAPSLVPSDATAGTAGSSPSGAPTAPPPDVPSPST